MKTSPRFSPALSSGAARLLGFIFIASLLARGHAAEGEKNYTLFMGTDFAVQKDQDYFRVLDVEGGSFVIKINGQEVRVPMRQGSGTMRVDQGLKLTPVSAKVDQLKTERAYTPENDPYAKFASRASGGTAAGESNTLSGMELDGANRALIGAQNQLVGAQLSGYAPNIASAQSDLSSASANQQSAALSYANNSFQTNFSSFNGTAEASLELQQALAEENFDAMRYSFELSSPTPLNRPYLVFIVHYHEKDAKPGTKQGTVIYAKAIEPVGDKPAKIRILQTGMPVGFIVEECQVRLYNGGQEIATNVAPRRVPLTKDEAFLYLKIDRIGRAKGASLPAAPALGRLDEETKSRLTLEQLKSPYYVQVSKDGRAEGVFTDPDCKHPADEPVAAVVQAMRFFPALEKGKEQAGVAKLVFAQVMI